jgi:hypothetical protein
MSTSINYLEETKKLADQLDKLGGDLSAITNYFLDDLGFEGVVIYKDKPKTYFDYHFHNTDDYIYVLEGGMTINSEGKDLDMSAGDTYIFPAKQVHNATISPQGCKYIIATRNGDFEAIFTSK